jgi:hypothetical protein
VDAAGHRMEHLKRDIIDGFVAENSLIDKIKLNRTVTTVRLIREMETRLS